MIKVYHCLPSNLQYSRLECFFGQNYLTDAYFYSDGLNLSLIYYHIKTRKVLLFRVLNLQWTKKNKYIKKIVNYISTCITNSKPTNFFYTSAIKVDKRLIQDLKMDKRENKNETVDFLENSTGINQSRSTDIFLSQLQIIKFNSF